MSGDEAGAEEVWDIPAEPEGGEGEGPPPGFGEDLEDLDAETRHILLHELREQEEQEVALAASAAKKKKGGWLRSTGRFAKKVGKVGYKGVAGTLGFGARAITGVWGYLKGGDEEEASIDGDPRHEHASPSGGLVCVDMPLVHRQRRLVLDVIKQLGRNILHGKDLLYVTFPVTVSQPCTVLQMQARQASYAPRFLARAAATSDPLERFKLVMVNYIASMHVTTGFTKPLNPILGETYQASMSDGTNLFMEQTSHHPPVSSWHCVGKGSSYEFLGWVTYSASFGYNRLRLVHSGKRLVRFADGQCVEYTNPVDQYGNVFWGQPVHETLGSIHFTDEANGLSCDLVFNAGNGLPTDYLAGDIVRAGGGRGEAEALSRCEGSWLGFVDFDQTRYWDIVSQRPEIPEPAADALPSDSRFRGDLVNLLKGDIEAAQAAKTTMEEAQRADRKLRAARAKRAAKAAKA